MFSFKILFCYVAIIFLRSTFGPCLCSEVTVKVSKNFLKSRRWLHSNVTRNFKWSQNDKFQHNTYKTPTKYIMQKCIQWLKPYSLLLLSTLCVAHAEFSNYELHSSICCQTGKHVLRDVNILKKAFLKMSSTFLLFFK